MTRVIRGEGSTVIPAEVFDAQRDAERIVRDARARGAEIIAESVARREGLDERARREGYERGRAESAALLARAAAVRGAALADAEQELVTLALGIARRVIEHELATSPERILPVVRETLDHARRAKEVVIIVHPEDAATLARLPQGALGVSFRIEAEPSLARGGCILRTELGRLDATIETKLEALASALTADTRR